MGGAEQICAVVLELLPSISRLREEMLGWGCVQGMQNSELLTTFQLMTLQRGTEVTRL